MSNIKINKHASVPFPEGWQLKNKTVHLPDGTTRKILEEVEGGGEGEYRRYRCIVPGCPYNNLFKEGSSAEFRRRAESWHGGGFRKKQAPVAEAVEVDSTLLTVFVPQGQMTEQSTATLLAASPQFPHLTFKVEGQVVDAREMFQLLDQYMPVDEMRDIIESLKHTPQSMHAALFKDLWLDLKKTNTKLITGVKNRLVQRWTKEKADAKYEAQLTLKAMAGAVTHGTIADFDDAWKEANALLKKLRKLALGTDADHVEREMDRLEQMLDDKQLMAHARPFYNLLIDTSEPIVWTSYLFHQVASVLRSHAW